MYYKRSPISKAKRKIFVVVLDVEKKNVLSVKRSHASYIITNR